MRFLGAKLSLIFIVVVAAVAVILLPPCTAWAKLIIWHNFAGKQAKLFAEQVREYSQISKEPCVVETGMEISSAMLRLRERRLPFPQMVVGSADLVAHDAVGKYSVVSPSLQEISVRKPLWQAVTRRGRILGVPFLQGNHLLLFYNKKFATKPVQDWRELAERADADARLGITTIVWYLLEPYYVLPFLFASKERATSANFLGVQPKKFRSLLSNSAEVLREYKRIANSGIAPKNCDYRCATSTFLEGKAAFAISGDWFIGDAEAALGSQLGLAALPKFDGQFLRSPFAPTSMFFPENSLAGPYGAVLRGLVRHLMEAKEQRRWWHEVYRIPANSAASPSDSGTMSMLYRSALKELNNAVLLPAIFDPLFWSGFRRVLQLHLSDRLSLTSAVDEMRRLSEAAVVLQGEPGER